MDYKDVQAGYTDDSCWVKGKTALIETLMKEACGAKTDLSILNVGAGTGNDLRVLNGFGKNFVVDIDQNALQMIDNALCVEKKYGDICDLPYQNEFFDVVVAFDVLEHIADDKKAVQEILRVLKPGGVLVFTVPAWQMLFSSHDKALHHFRRYNKKGLRSLFTHFREQKIWFWNTWLFFPMAVFRLFKKRSEPKVDYVPLPPLLNTFFFGLLKFDNFLIRRNVSLPFGLSLVGYCSK